MADNTVEITFKGTNQVGPAVDSVKESLTGVSEAATKTSSAFDTAMGMMAAQEVQRFADAVSGFMLDAITEAGAAEDGLAQLEAVLKSTGGAAGITSEAAQDLANSLSSMTRFEDDAVLSAENMLLTFTSIGKDIFPQATATVLDMSQALGQDLKSSAIQLGKALNDPVNGVTALQRVGVQFTESQKELIKSLVEAGKTEEAQKLILQELQKEFGGSAEAAGKTFAGSMDRLTNAFGNFEEAIGKAMTQNKLFQGMIDRAITLLEGLSAGFEKLPAPVQTGIVAIGGIVAILAKLAPTLIAVKVLFGGLGASAAASGTAAGGAATGFSALLAAVAPVVGVLAAFIATAAGLGQVAQWAAAAGKAFQEFLGVQLPAELTAARDAMITKGPFSAETWAAARRAVAVGLAGILAAFKSWLPNARNFGREMVNGISAGIKSGWSWLTEQVRSLAQSLLDAAKAALGISSPSKVFAEQVGLPMAQGVQAGFSQGMSQSAPAMGALLRPSPAYAYAGSGPGAGDSVGGSYTINVYGELSPEAASRMRREAQGLANNAALIVAKRRRR